MKAEGGLCFMSEEDRGIGGLKGPLFCELGRVGGGGGIIAVCTGDGGV